MAGIVAPPRCLSHGFEARVVIASLPLSSDVVETTKRLADFRAGSSDNNRHAVTIEHESS
jgi:hypothetical protein